MFVYLSKKISIPNNVQMHAISWSHNDGFIATGGADGLLKVLKLETAAGTTSKDSIKGLAAPSNLSINQNLEGHSGAIQVIAWNEVYQKLTTSDSHGLIIVWMMYKGSWYEEMINNRNKSVVADMAWSPDGSKICIVYEDGVVIVGSVDGNRLWSKEIQGSMVAVVWSVDCRLLLFGMATGEVHAYDTDGNFVLKLLMLCLNNAELEAETGVSVGMGRSEYLIVTLQWYAPTPAKEVTDSVSGEGSTPAPGNKREREPAEKQFALGIPDDRPRLAVVYQHGVMQMMRHESDTDPIIIQMEKMMIVSARWSPDGTMLAIAGNQLDLPDGERNVVHFITAYGEKLRTLKVPGRDIAGCSWEATGLRVCLAVDSHLFFANIRPDYKWGYCGQTVVYSYPRPEKNEHCVVFYDVKLEEMYVKSLRFLRAIASFGDYCTLINRADDPGGIYLLQLCNGIGTPVDFKYVDIDPVFVAMNSTEVLVASHDAFYLWHYVVPRKAIVEINKNLNKPRGDTIWHVDEVVQQESAAAGKQADVKKAFTRTDDAICSICMGEKFFLVGRESGTLQKYSLPNAVLQYKYALASRPEHMALNSNETRLSVVNAQGVLHFYDLTETAATMVPSFERKDVWNVKWDSENEHSLAIMEKTRMFVLRGTDPEEPVVNSGYICSFKDLTVRTVLLDELLRDPESPDKDLIVDIEIKSLRDAKLLLEKMNIQEASAFIEKNSHPKLWSLLAEVALSRMDTVTAEHAFVKLKDYGGIQFVKKVNGIQNEALKKAEVAAYFGRFDEAEKVYMENDRRDLALALRRKMNDWFRILQILQMSSEPGDDQLLQQAWNHVGDYFADRQKWAIASRHYEPGQNYKQLARCYLMLEDYEKLEQLMRQLPEGNELLMILGEMFGNAGLCEQAVEAFMKSDQINSALDVCIQLNQWESAVQLAKSHHVRDIDSLLGKYAEQLTGNNEKSLAAVQLYRKAGRFLDAAKLIYDIAQEEKERQATPLRLKKLYVLGALLIENYHEQNKAKAAAMRSKTDSKRIDAQAALSGLLAEDDSVSVIDSKMIDGAWRGAEACHFYMLAQQQLYQGNVDAAMKTTLHLTDYDDILDPLEIFSLLALASCAARQFSVCSRAFIKLESVEGMAQAERDAFQKLALDIFTKNSPKDNRTGKAECTGCETLIPDYCQVCPSCDTKFPTCIVTGRPLMDYQFWLCPVCKHRAYEQEIQSHKFCPLCHVPI